LQDALQRSERDYRELTETIHDVIWRIDAESLTYLYVSPAVHRLLGYTAEELIGRPLIDAQSDENRRWISHLRELYAQSQQASDLNEEPPPYRLDELQHLHRDGSVVWSEVTTTLVRSSSSGSLEFHCVSRDITGRKQAESQLEWLAFYDQLTELPNRTLVHNLLEQVLRTAHREAKPVALLMLGLDRFKTINDSSGFDTGDAILMEVARRLKQELRATDLIGRIGSDEFLLVLPGASGTEAGQLGELLQKAIRRPFTIREQTINLTSSIGIALYPLDGTDQAALVRKADTAMTQAKRNGRNRFHFFTSSLEKEVVRMVELANALHGALDRQELRLLYQPQIDIRSGQVLGAEALLRWQHYRLGPVNPAEFIPIAEGNGQILSIGEWVLQQAILQLREWQRGGLKLRQIAVNLSAVQFRQQDLAERVIVLLQEAGLASHQLDLELTESVTIDNPEAAIEAMARFSDAGIQLSIDDFGTGYSSLSYLKRLRVNKLKIDASFVRDLASSSDDRSIVSAIINLARGLNIRTIAEGVESEDQLAVLRELGCDEIQGFLYARPLTSTEFEDFARRHGTSQSS
jgi:diguanylate cyclase (GGDEF)-like protein/PAS domain S-box-containing protein